MSYFWKYFSREGREKRREEAEKVDSEIKEIREGLKLEKGDTLAIIIAALTTLLPYVLLVWGILAVVILLIFRAF